jgi:hypothetical protein
MPAASRHSFNLSPIRFILVLSLNYCARCAQRQLAPGSLSRNRKLRGSLFLPEFAPFVAHCYVCCSESLALQ